MKNNTEESIFDLPEEEAKCEIDLTDENEARKAFIASEIFTRKY